MQQRIAGALTPIVVLIVAVTGGVVAGSELDLLPQIDDGVEVYAIELVGFSPSSQLFIVPCEAPLTSAGYDMTAIDPETCDTSGTATTFTNARGRGLATVEWNVPSEGIAVHVGDTLSSPIVTTVVFPVRGVVTEIQGPLSADGANRIEITSETPPPPTEVAGAIETAAGPPPLAASPIAAQQNDLANTGFASTPLMGIATMCLLAGGLAIAMERRVRSDHLAPATVTARDGLPC